MSKERIVCSLSIVERGKGTALIQRMNENGISFHLQSVGRGTAPSEVMEILGFGSNDKDIIISFAPEQIVNRFIHTRSENVFEGTRYGGLMMVSSLTAINRIAAEILTRSHKEEAEKEEEIVVEKEHKFNLILIAANEGYANDIMQAARKVGATGGTIIRARLAGIEKFEQVADVEMQEEKEILTILAPIHTCPAIMTAVNQEFGLRTPAKGTVCSMPIDQVMKI